MAFKKNNLSVFAYANGFTLWHYVTKTDKIKDLESTERPSYFLPVRNLMNTGDIIILNGSDATVIRKIVLADNKVKIKPLD